MKYLIGLFFSILLLHNVQAAPLCDASCELTITFPDSGSIEAVELLTITFGDGGFINDGFVATGKAAGNIVQLSAGESIAFGAGGQMILGSGGNIDYSNMIISSSGSARLKATGGTETIFIDRLTFAGGVSITLDGKRISITGTVTVDPGSTVSLIADLAAPLSSVCTIQDANNGVTLSAGLIDTTDTCNTISASGGLNLSAGVVTVGTVDPNATLITNGNITLTPVSIGTGGITLQPQTLTPEWLLTLPDGTQLPTEDGNTCVLATGECVAATGEKYVVLDGKLVLATSAAATVAVDDSATAMFAPVSLFAVFFLLSVLRYGVISCRKNGRY